MIVKDFESEVNAGINEKCIVKAKVALTESAKNLMAAKAVVKKLEKRHNEMLKMDVEEFLFDCNQVDEFDEMRADSLGKSPLSKWGSVSFVGEYGDKGLL